MSRRRLAHAAALFGLALAPRLGLWLRARPFPDRFVKPDSVEYLQLAGDLRGRHEFLDAAGRPALNRTPGYPLFLAAGRAVLGENVPRLVLLQVLLACLTPAAIYGLCLLGSLGEPAALAAGAAWALDLNDVLHSLLVSTESLFCLALAGGVLFLLAAREGRGRGWAGLSGLTLSAASFLRPISLYLPLTLSPWLVRRGRGTALLFLLAAYALPGAWVLRNHARLGRWEFCSISETNLLYWRAAAIESLSTGRPINEIKAQWHRQFDERYAGQSPTEADEARFDVETAMPIVRAHPGLGLRLMATGAIKTMGGHALDLLNDLSLGPVPAPPAANLTGLAGSGTRWLLKARPALWLPLLASLAFLGLVYAGAAAGALELWRGGRGALLALLVWGAYYFLFLSSGAESYYRFRMPVMVFLLPLAGAGWAPVRERFRRRPEGR